MNIREQLLKVHSKSNNLLICNWIGGDSKKFALLIDAFLDKEYRVVQRAAWSVSTIGVKHPHLLLPHIDVMINAAEHPIHPAVLRNIFKLMAEAVLPISEAQEGRLLNLSFDLLTNPAQPVAIRVHCMQFIANLCKSYPDLAIELKEIIEDGMEYGSAGFKSRGRKILKQLSS